MVDIKYIKEKFYLCGYYIVEPIKIKNWMNQDILPGTILSASECICDFFPSKKYMKDLMPDESVYSEVRCWIKNKLGNDLGYPNIFYNYESAAEFCEKFLCDKKNLKIIGIAIPRGKWADAFLGDEVDYDVFKNIKEEDCVDDRGEALGYEILKYDFERFHSYICDELYEDYNEKYGFKLNSNGFIYTLEEAEKLADYTNEEINGGEPVFWCPWLILEYSIK